jgi:hypothetical protein
VAAEGGAELDVQRRIIEEMLRIARSTLRGRIQGDRDERGLRLDEELDFEARRVSAERRIARQGGELPPASDSAWAEEARRTPPEEIQAYIHDKIEHAASKCKPFITLNVGAPLLPDKAYAVMHPAYDGAFSEALAHLSAHRIDKGQIVHGEDPHTLIFYYAQLGCPLHAVRSMAEYERRYFVVKERELSEGGKMPGVPKGVPQIPLHQDKGWEGAPDPEARLFRVSLDGIKANDAKLAWAERTARRRERHGDREIEVDDLRDFTLGVAFALIRHRPDGAAGEGFYLEDPDLGPADARLGKFRDQAFASYRGRIEVQKQWLRKEWAARLAKLDEERDPAAIRAVLDPHAADLERQLKTSGSVGGKPVAEHLAREIASFAAFRAERGL